MIRNILPLLFFSIFHFSSLLSQSYKISQQVIGSGGQCLLLGAHKIDFTFGESVIQTLGNEELEKVITQGFHQPENYLVVGTYTIAKPEELGLIIFPNPTVNSLHLQFSNTDLYKEYKMVILDITGKPVTTPELINSRQNDPINCQALVSGSYLLFLRSESDDLAYVLPFSKIN